MLISLLDKLSQASTDSTVGFWLLTKGVNDIFNEHSACTHRIPSNLPTAPCQFPQGQDLASGHHLAGLVQSSPFPLRAYVHVCARAGTRVCLTAQRKHGLPAWMETTKQVYDLQSCLYFSWNCYEFFRFN